MDPLVHPPSGRSEQAGGDEISAPRVGQGRARARDRGARRSVARRHAAPRGRRTRRRGTRSPLAALRIATADADHPYDRDRFGGWIDGDGDCQNTRAEVLAAESLDPPTFTTAERCTVAAGRWIDPWSGRVDTDASRLDVDHTVPLANAWRSGAWAWSDAERRAYANDLDDADHLVAIPLGENRAKADGGPEAWRPPDRSSWCRYARTWAQIKARWQLTATQAEWDALVAMTAAC